MYSPDLTFLTILLGSRNFRLSILNLQNLLGMLLGLDLLALQNLFDDALLVLAQNLGRPVSDVHSSFSMICFTNVTILFVCNLKIVKQRFVLVLSGETGVHEVSIDVSPFTQTAIIKEFEVIGDNEWNDAIAQTLLEHQQATNSAIAVLKGMYLLKAYVKVEDIL